MKLSRYPAHRSSRVTWLGDIAEDWDVRPIKYLVITPVTDGPHATPEIFSEGIPFVSAEAINHGRINFDNIRGHITEEDHNLFSKKYKPKRGDIYLVKSGATTGRVAIVETDVEFNIWSPLAAIRCDPDIINQYFLFFYMHSREFQTGIELSWSFGTQQNIGMGVIENLDVPIPSLPEQQQIAAFLDWKTGQIDALIARKKELLEKLKERRLAVITQAVTRGLNPAAPLRDSGIPWLGKVPAHWQVKNLKFCLDSLNNRRVPLSSEERAGMPKEYPYYGASGIIGYVEDYLFDEPLILIGEDGANLLSRSTPLAFEAHGKYWVNNHAHILKPALGPFTYWSHLLCIVQYAPWITGAAQPKLTKDNLGTVPLPCPPVAEQEAIAEFIRKASGEIDPLVIATEQTIARLTEYRTALITAATTGKIDVRGVKIPRPTA